jgi:hypothetical protein
MIIIRGSRLVHFGKIADIYFSLTVELTDKRTTHADAKHEFFSRIVHRQLFSLPQETMNFIKHSRKPEAKPKRFDERGNLNARHATLQAKFVKFFTISSRLM